MRKRLGIRTEANISQKALPFRLSGPGHGRPARWGKQASGSSSRRDSRVRTLTLPTTANAYHGGQAPCVSWALGPAAVRLGPLAPGYLSCHVFLGETPGSTYPGDQAERLGPSPPPRRPLVSLTQTQACHDVAPHLAHPSFAGASTLSRAKAPALKQPSNRPQTALQQLRPVRLELHASAGPARLPVSRRVSKRPM